MAFVLIEDNVVIQRQPYFEEGFVETDEHAWPGMIATLNESGKYTFSTPDYEPEEPQPISYPTAQIVADRITGEPYEVFVENGVLTSEPLGDSNG